MTEETIELQRLYIDWAVTKPIVVWDGKEAKSMTLQQLQQYRSSSAVLYIEGSPPFERDNLCRAGFTVYTCSTQEVQRIRRAGALQKSDKLDAKLLSKLPRSAWHKWIPTEPEIIELKILLSHRRNILGLVKLQKQHLKLKGYQYHGESELEDLEHKLKAVNLQLVHTCKSLGLHKLHEDLYGVGCQAALVALSKRPWTFDHGIAGWLRYNGLTAQAWDEFPRNHSLGCDVELKSTLYGASQPIVSKKSPYREQYLTLKEELKPTSKKGGEGRGSWKVSSHAKAFNRIVTQIALRLYEVEVKWFRGRSEVKTIVESSPLSSHLTIRGLEK